MGQGAEYYESAAARDEYMAFHYPECDAWAALLGEGTPPPSARYPFALRAMWEEGGGGRALDIGCACGRITFDLARHHEEAVGLDRSASLVAAAREVQASGRARYRLREEGASFREVEVAVEAARNARFEVGDALALPFGDGAFRTVVACNLLDRVPDPARALAEAARVTAPRGVLLVGSPFTWLEEYTPRDRWLVPGAERVAALLGAAFRLEQATALPFFIRHHARSGQLAVSGIQRFRRNP